MEEKEMKKRIFALATALVMTLSMGMTALAARSPIVDDTADLDGVFAESATAVIDGQVVELDFTYHPWNIKHESTEAQKQQLEYYTLYHDDSGVADEREKDLFEQVMGYRDESVSRKDYFGLNLPDGYTMPAEGIEVTINAPYAGDGTYNYYIFHCKADGTWEYIPTTEGNGTLSGRFTSFSPVFIMKALKENTTVTPPTIENPEPNEEIIVEKPEPTEKPVPTEKSVPTEKPVPVATTTTNTTVTTKAPKTGDSTGIYVAGLLSIISVAGIVVYIKREKIVK